MGDVERHTLFSRFKKQERAKYQETEMASRIKAEGEITAENQDYLHDLQKQFELLDLDPFIAQLRGDLLAIKEAMEPYEGSKNEIGIDVWRFNLAVPGKWFDQDTAVRAATGLAFQLYYERPDLAEPEKMERFDRIPLDYCYPYFDHAKPTFIIVLYQPTSQPVQTDEALELADVAPMHIFVGLSHGPLLEGMGVTQAVKERSRARFDHEKKEGRRFRDEVREAVGSDFKAAEPWKRKPFVWNQEINEIKNKSQITNLNKNFGIVIEKTKPKFRRKINIEFIKGAGREESEVFFPERAGVIRSQIDQKVWDFLRSQPMYAPYLESPFPEDA